MLLKILKTSELDSRNQISSILADKNQTRDNKHKKQSKQQEKDKQGFERED